MTGVTTLHSFGHCPTTRTCGCLGSSSQRHRDLVGNLDLLNHSVRKIWKNHHRRHSRRRRLGNEGRRDFTPLSYHIWDQRGCVRVKLCVKKTIFDSSIQAQSPGGFMSQKWRSYSLSDTLPDAQG